MKDPTCIFCKIVAGEIPSHKVLEDDKFIAFIDIRPLAPGHTLVIPKEHHRWVWDVPEIGQYFENARKIALAIRKSFGEVEQINSRIIGEEVPHAHIWIFPEPALARGDKNDFATNAEKIRAALG